MNALTPLAHRWPEINQLLDEALALEPAERTAWLESLHGPRAELRDTVARLLRSQAHAESGDFMEALPPLPLPPVGAAGMENEPAVGTQVGPYTLIEALGHGGMGSVWLAERHDGALHRRVALKLPRLVWGGAVAERLTRERDILATLEHPHIARLYDAGVDVHGRPWLAMEVVHGRPIDEHCAAQALPVRQRLRLLLQVAAAVAHAHARLVVHRDLKPANILVTDGGEVRLLDFGIAKLLEGDLTQETALTRMAGAALTPDYASPEQIRGEALATASDVYSLGVVAYELLAGVRPYRLRRGSRAELEEAIALADPPLASEMAATPALKKALRGDLDAILNRALKKDPGQRYASVDAMARDIERHLQGEPVLARPDSLRYRSLRFVQRHRLPVAAGAAVMTALLAGAAVALWQAGQARQQADKARAEAAALSAVGEFMFGSVARMAADPKLAAGEGRGLIAQALRTELERVRKKPDLSAKALSEVYGNAAAMFNYLQMRGDSLQAALEELQQLQRAGADKLELAESHRQVALAYYRLDRDEEALKTLEAGRRLLPPAPDARTRTARARLWRASGMYLLHRGQPHEARVALESARRELEPELVATSHFHGAATIELARALSELGDDLRPLSLLDEVEAVYRRLPGLTESEWGGVELARGVVLEELGRYAGAEQAWRRSAALYGKQFGLDGPNAAGIDARLARALTRQGRHAESQALLDRALAIADRNREDTGTGIALRILLTRADLALDRGDLAGAARELQAARAVDSSAPASVVQQLGLQARIASAQGRHDEARQTMAQALGRLRQEMPQAVRAMRALLLGAAAIELAAGQPAQARALLQDLPPPSAGSTDLTRHAVADLRAAIDLADGRPDEALAWLQSPLARLGDAVEAKDSQDAARSAHEEALARITWALALRQRDQGEAAQRLLQRARTLLGDQHAGSPWLARWRAAAGGA